MSRLLAGSPTLRARDVQALANWYRDSLGFEVRFLWEEPPTYAVIGRDSVRLGIARSDGKFGAASVYIVVEDVNGLYTEFLSRSVTISRPLEQTGYQMRDFDLFDPDGNRLCFGEPIETEPG